MRGHERGRWLAVLLIANAVALLAGLPASAAGTSARPNLILVLMDDMKPGQFAYMPALRARTEGGGILFEQARPPTALCAPSRATLMRGRTAHNTGVRRNTDAAAFRDDEGQAIGAVLRATHDTGYFGKYLNDFDASAVPLGWDDFHGMVDSGSVKKDAVVNRNGQRVTLPGWITERMADAAVAFIDQPRDRPFALVFAPPEPHAPHVLPPGYGGILSGIAVPRPASFNEADVTDKMPWFRKPPLSGDQIAVIDASWRNGARAVRFVDDQLRRLAAAAENAGPTVWIAVSDNGKFFGEHRHPESKNTPHDAAALVTLAIDGPGIPQGKRSHLVSLADLLPTVCGMMSIPCPIVDGRSLMPIIEDPAAPWRRSMALTRYKTHDLRAVVTARHLMIDGGPDGTELYDRRDDPWQMRSLSPGAHPALVSELRGLIADLVPCSGATCREVEDRSVP